jgi:CubicO group peptidase (beta-lactamase class C family)
MLLNEGMHNGKRILSRNSVRLMTTNQMGDLIFGSGSQTINKFGFGFMLITQKGSAASIWQEGTYTGGGAFVTNCWIDPKEKLTVQMMVNLLPFSHAELVEKVKNLVYQSIID